MSSYRALFEIGKSLFAETEITKLLPLAMDKVIEQTKAQRGMIMVYGQEDEILVETARHFDKKDIAHPDFEISRTIIQRVRETGQYMVVKNAFDDPQFRNSESIARLRLLSVACAPLTVKDRNFGVVYVDNRDLTAVFDDETGKLLSEFSDLIAVAVKNALDRKRLVESNLNLLAEREASRGYGEIIGSTPAMQEIFNLIDKIADKNIAVLITGETGTGKELVARALHQKSSRRDQNFVAINCANLAEALLESELFGCVKGAYTGAVDKEGWIEAADKGTLFLDEIGDMGLTVQAKLLRFLESQEFTRLGSRKPKKADVRLITATNRDLAALLEQEKFRPDLYHRLNDIELKLPPLRERGNDILEIAEYFLKRYVKEFDAAVFALSEEARALLLRYPFPGNVRELQKDIKRGVALAEGDTIRAEDLPPKYGAASSPFPPETKTIHFAHAKQSFIEQFEREFITKLLRETHGNISEAARRGGMYKKNFIQKMQQYGIKREDYIRKT